MKIAFVFPGQGSQSLGMLSELAAQSPEVGQVFARASRELGYDLWALVQHGPEEQLNRTECTQPAMLAAGAAAWEAWCASGGTRPDVVAGHSLGEFTALVAAGVLELEAAVAAVRFRGQVMQEAVPLGQGAVAAVLGLDDAEVQAACAEAAQGEVVEPVNYNSPGQIVIAGHTAAVNRALEAAKGRGAKRGVLLPVSVPVHSSLMRPAAERFAVHLRALRFAEPRLRFVSSVDAREYREPGEIRELLVRQLASPVQWTATVRALIAGGSRRIVECGPGRVLTALNRRIEKVEGLECLALESPATLEQARSSLASLGVAA